jgi:hypothetical protein
MSTLTFVETNHFGTGGSCHISKQAWLNSPVQSVDRFWRLAFGIPDTVKVRAVVPAVVNGEWAIVVVESNNCVVYNSRKLSPLAFVEALFVSRPGDKFNKRLIADSHRTVDSVLENLLDLRTKNAFGCGDPFCWGVGSLFWAWKYSQSIHTCTYRQWLWNILAIG